MKTLTTIALVVLSFTLAPTSDARVAERDPTAESSDERDWSKAKKRLQRIRLRLLRDKVGLSAEDVTAVTKILDGNQQKRWTLRREMKTANRRLKALVEADPSDEQAFENTIDALLRSRKELERIRHDELSTLRRILKPREVGRLMLALEQLKRKMHRKRGKRGGEGHDGMKRQRDDAEPGPRRGRRGGR